MGRALYVTSILTTWFVVANCARHDPSPAASPISMAPSTSPMAPSSDCSSIIYDMADCISFLSDGSSETKPTLECCSGFETVLKVNEKCICEAIKSSAELGIELNVTMAMTLPSACGVSAPPISHCGISLSPVNPPEPSSPDQAPFPSTPASANSPVGGRGGLGNAPAPSLEQSGAGTLSISFAIFISMLLVAFTGV